MMPVEREFVSPEFVTLGTKLGCAEMIRSGVTCFADMYYFEDAIARAAADAGMRALCGQTVLRFPAPDAKSYEDSLLFAREFIETWHGHPLIVPAPAPHAPYTCTPDILRACAELAVEFDVPLQIHLSETALEVENSRREHGMPVVPWVKKQGLFDAKVLAAHCVHVDDGEIRALKNVNAGVAHNPTSNLKLGAGIAPVARMLRRRQVLDHYRRQASRTAIDGDLRAGRIGRDRQTRSFSGRFGAFQVEILRQLRAWCGREHHASFRFAVAQGEQVRAGLDGQHQRCRADAPAVDEYVRDRGPGIYGHRRRAAGRRRARCCDPGADQRERGEAAQHRDQRQHDPCRSSTCTIRPRSFCTPSGRDSSPDRRFLPYLPDGSTAPRDV